jgi:hypothetical protein
MWTKTVLRPDFRGGGDTPPSPHPKSILAAGLPTAPSTTCDNGIHSKVGVGGCTGKAIFTWYNSYFFLDPSTLRREKTVVLLIRDN